MNDGALIEAAKAARLLGLDRRTLIRWIQRGVVSGSKPGGRWVMLRADFIALRTAAALAKQCMTK